MITRCTEARVEALESWVYRAEKDLTEISGAISTLRTEMHEEIGNLRTEVGELRTEMRTEIGDLRTEVRTEIGELRTEMRTEMGKLRDDRNQTDKNVRLLLDHFGIKPLDEASN